ncbi:MAG TPA: STAS domain-containing protein [bacterium]|nr:STAS domain-containing protein [bacterium]HQO35619.1 STAS domain-containing protein [bacterium]HQP97672.1 STAS domain-containing protein [bacterium]
MIKVNSRKHNDIVILDLFGTIDLEGIEAVKEAISRERQSGCKKMILGMKGVDSIVSSVIQRLQSTITAFWVPGGRIVLVDLSVGNRRVLEKQAFFKMLIVADTEEEALEALAK